MIRFYCTIALIIICLSSTAQSITPQQKMESMLMNLFDPNAPGGVVTVVEKGEMKFNKAYGLSNLSKNALLSTDAIFRIGSITKQFTAVAILKLVQEGKISLQDDIRKYIPYYPTNGHTITIEHLLTHTSGIKSYTSMGHLMAQDKKAQEIAPLAMVNAFKNEPMDFSPGDRFLYNNSGYFLLGAIIEKVTKQSWGKYITNKFLKPLSMSTAFTYDPKLNAQATGYTPMDGGAYVEADYVHPSIPYAAGAMFATTQDLVKWNTALFSGKVLPKSLLEKAFTPLTLNDGRQESYGYGWQLGKIDGLKVIGHGGGIDGFISYALYVPEKDVCVVVLLNSTAHTAESIAYQVASLQLGIYDKKEFVVSVPSTVLEPLAGVYESIHGSYYIFYEDGRLIIQPSGGVRKALLPLSPERFVSENDPVNFSFTQEGNDVVMRIEDHQFVDKIYRRTNKPLPSKHSDFVYTQVMFDELAGEYTLNARVTCKIFRLEDKFYTQLTGQAPVEILPKKQDVFFGKEVDFTIYFKRDENNKVIGLTIVQGIQELYAQRSTLTARIAITVNQEILKKYEGRYALAPAAVMTITMKDGALVAQLTGQPAVNIYASSENEFFYKVVDAQIKFNVTQENMVESLTLYQNGRVIKAPKLP
jgi:CubicO group peptidase (beta-lactamase class C family)